MNMPMPGPQGQPPAGDPQGQPPQGQPPQGQQGQGQNPIIQCIQILGQFVQHLAQRDPAAGKAAAKNLQGLIEAIKGSSGEQKEGPKPPGEEGQEPPAEAKQEAQGKKRMGAMPENAKPGAVQVL